VLFVRRRRRADRTGGDRLGAAPVRQGEPGLFTPVAAEPDPAAPVDGFWPGQTGGRVDSSSPAFPFTPADHAVSKSGFTPAASFGPAGSPPARPAVPAWDVPPEPPGTAPWPDAHAAIVVRDVPPGHGASATEPVPLVRDRDVYPAPAAPEATYEVAFGDDLVTARVTAGAALWRPLPQDVPAGRAVVCVGAAPAGCLFLDLATAPGALAIDGPVDAVERLAEAFAYQLAGEPSRTSVALLGDLLLGLDGGPGVRRAPSLGAAAASASSDHVVAFLPAGHETSGGLLRGPLNGPRLIEIRLGAADRASWSFTLLPGRAARAWQERPDVSAGR
jgi:hypothetical protein